MGLTTMPRGLCVFLIAICMASLPALGHTDVTVSQAKDLIDSTDDLIVLDVREPSEYCDSRGHIPGALNYPWNSGVLQARFEELPIDSPTLVVCRSGGRSNQAANFLDSKGFLMVYDMLGGMNAWLSETTPCKYSGGSGSAEDPYQIATAADLIALGETPEDYDKHFVLTADIDLDPNLPGRRVFDRAVIAPPMIIDSVIGPYMTEAYLAPDTGFTGIFDGNGHVISHLTMIGESYLGLFGYLAPGGEIAGIGVRAADVNGTGGDVGGLVGFSDGRISVSYCSGRVSGETNVGGLVGFNGGSITNSYSSSEVSGDGDVGGLIGSNGWGHATNSYSTGMVSGNDDVGGFVGYNGGSITTSFSTGAVSAGRNVGGLVGFSGGGVANSYSTGEVSGEYSVGGLVGYNGGSITTSYSTGAPSGTEGPVGGLVGNNASGGSIIASFWDTESSGLADSDGGIGVGTAEMQSIGTYLNRGWDFAGEALNGTCDYWWISPANCPRLRHHAGENPVMPEGSGTAEAPYLIRDARDLGTVWLKPLAHYRLEAPMDLSGITWSTAIIPWFAGVFEGNRHTISHLDIQGGEWLGLFGCLACIIHEDRGYSATSEIQ